MMPQAQDFLEESDALAAMLEPLHEADWSTPRRRFRRPGTCGLRMRH